MKVYLGDAVYAKMEPHGITLTTEDGIRTTNVIFLEPDVLANLVKVCKEYWENLKREREKTT